MNSLSLTIQSFMSLKNYDPNITICKCIPSFKRKNVIPLPRKLIDIVIDTLLEPLPFGAIQFDHLFLEFRREKYYLHCVF